MQIEHRPTLEQFVARLPGGDATLSYSMVDPSLMDIESTWVPPESRGQGIGGELVETALTFARQAGLTVRPSCWYVRTWVGQHPEFAGLLEP